MYRKISDFQADWDYEINATLKLFSNLKDEKLDIKVCNEGRSLGKIAGHIALSCSDAALNAGFKGNYEPEDSNALVSVKKINEILKRDAETLLDAIKSSWNDSQMEDEIEVYGMIFKKGVYLRSLVNHLIHHRGQITVLMRQSGLKVTGVYGPSKEEWADYNLPPQD
jgi:uncharacterized damage-inducible protein DinB